MLPHTNARVFNAGLGGVYKVWGTEAAWQPLAISRATEDGVDIPDVFSPHCQTERLCQPDDVSLALPA
jgi:hypothetical protein